MLVTVTMTTNGLLAVKTPYHPYTVSVLKENIDARRRFDDATKCWLFPCEAFVVEKLLDCFVLDPKALPEEAQALLEPMPEVKAADLALIAGYSFLTAPFEHQRSGLAELVEHDRWFLAWEQGLGKSKTIADRLKMLFDKEGVKKTLILCPKSVLTVWPGQLMEHAGLDCRVWGQKLKKHAELPPILIANYDVLLRNWKQLYKERFEIVVADEAHLIKRSTASRSRYSRTVASNAKYRWALSGTPAPNSLLDWFGTLSFLDHRVAGTTSKVAFEARYAIKKPMSEGSKMRVVVGYQNLSDLRKRVMSITSRLKKVDCLDLPEKIFCERRCELEGDQARVYRALRADAVAELKSLKAAGTLTIRNVLTESLRLLQVVGGFVPDDNGHVHPLKPNVKLALLNDVLDEFEDDKPLVIWTIFREELSAVADLLADRGRNVRVLHGDVKDADRKTAVDDFQSGRANTFLGTPQAGGMGLTLTAADVNIYYSRNHNLATWLQSSDRSHRIGQTRTVTVISLIADNTVDEKVAHALTRKEAMQELLMSRDVEDLL